MDQDKFRSLLGSGGAASSSSSTFKMPRAVGRGGGRIVVPQNPTKAVAVESQADFKPRKVKKSADGYRDRAAERRHEPEDSPRASLPSLADLPMPSKGLDFALLESERRKVEQQASIVDDDALESAFAEVSATTPATPKKRTRDDLIKELQQKRATPGQDAAEPNSTNLSGTTFETAKAIGKFKPIGQSAEEMEKKKKRKKKKQDAREAQAAIDHAPSLVDPPGLISGSPKCPDNLEGPLDRPAMIEPDKVPQDEPDDTDIFADAGEYEGVDLGDEEAPDVTSASKQKTFPDPASTLTVGPAAPMSQRPKAVNWFDDPITEATSLGLESDQMDVVSVSPPREVDEEAVASSSRLVPLSSSSIKDIKGFLAIDKQLEKEEARKARKEKNKANNG